jgi:GTP-binding protein
MTREAGASPTDVLHAEFIASAVDTASMPAPTLAEIAFGGRSNVGKSSMLNALMQRRGLVRTSSTPGCTRAINQFEARTRDDLRLHLVDLPGYGFAKRSKAERTQWGELIERYLVERPTLRALVVIVDARRGVEDDDVQLLEFCAQPRPGNAPLSTLVAATKLDLLPKAKRKPAIEAMRKTAKRPVIGFSAETSEGRDLVWRAIARAVLGEAQAQEPAP